ncbi:hypothetical protein [Streptomyces sp. TLI_171]|uniref:hypothetical protein n=1 Tax=Streptomyces sp. TLI_171 TaxID=1938859 RepID=UPI000C5B9A6F|nr:hypothetical protein [Streptomyces sp. TLI_171]RKE05023.1 hypothetical protein BX266_7268 [Streptomyces sp. TLI_171]
MTHTLPLPSPQSIFRDDEPVVQSGRVLPGAVPPRFGDTDRWDFNGVLRKAPNRHSASLRVILPDLSPQWNLMAREIAMIWLNPRHPKVLACGIHLKPTPHSPITVAQRIGHLRALVLHGAERGLPHDPSQWVTEDFDAYIGHRLVLGEAISVTDHINVTKALHRLRSALAGGGVAVDPWPGRSANDVLGLPTIGPIRTKAIDPGTWFPLVRAAWTYIDVLAPDILTALNTWRMLRAQAQHLTTAEASRRLDAWLADPATRVPVHPHHTDPVNWSLVSHMIGIDPTRTHLFGTGDHPSRRRRAAVERLVHAGRTQPGLLATPAEVIRPDGTSGPWTAALHPIELRAEATALRNACYLFTVALSMMRDCEVRDIVKGSVVEYFSSPAVKSVKEKLDPDLPVKHWWIIEPVARAIDIASQLSADPQLAFSSAWFEGAGFVSGQVPQQFRTHVNANRHTTGLPEIPDSRVTPHMFRRTIAMLTRDHPGSEIAVGMQLKHVAARALANRTTQGYMEPDPKWARHLTQAIHERRLQRLTDLFDADTRGETIGYGPGSDRLRDAFADIRHQADHLRTTGQARHGDARVEHDLLRRTRISIRFGTLNHCTMNDADPAEAKCLENATVPVGHQGPLLDRCQPSRCANSVIAPEHLPIWQSERTSLNRLLDQPDLPAARRAHLDAQLADVDLVIKKARP